jgi:hypothetical protein
MWIEIEKLKEHVKGREMFVVKAFDVVLSEISGYKYTTDPWCVWLSDDGSFSRWPHSFPPTHFHTLPENM